MSPIMRAPEVTAIGNVESSRDISEMLTCTLVGQISFESAVTLRKEPYPVAASVIGPPGEIPWPCDYPL